MKIVAIIGPFRAETGWAIEQNCRKAEAVALEVWRAGAVAWCPHMNTRPFHGVLPDEVWLQGDLSVLSRCDAAILVEGWQQSSGSLDEKAEAERVGIPVFETIEALRAWLNGTEEKERP